MTESGAEIWGIIRDYQKYRWHRRISQRLYDHGTHPRRERRTQMKHPSELVASTLRRRRKWRCP